MSKPNPLGSLGSLIQPKGTAQRPVDVQQRGELAPAPAAAVQPAAEKEQAKELKALTYRMPVKDWRILRDYAHQAETSHQRIIDEALRQWCKNKGIPLGDPPRGDKAS
jgi:hypothetical protein